MKRSFGKIAKTVAICAALFGVAYLAGYGIGRGIRKIKDMSENLKYPETVREGVIDNYHGTEIADPYRWLEDDNSERTAAWVKAQNEVTFGYLNSLPQREAIRERLTELWNYPTQGAPAKRGEWYYISRNSGLQNQSVIYRKRNLTEAEEEVFFDPNTLSEDGTVALNTGTFTKDGRYFAYSLASAGSDWVEIFVLDTKTMKPLDDHIKWVKFSGASWTRDGRGFYY
ncbi:MAG: S9 family peptidase, partial [Alistipes sp.]|nr:S9 family peptidase [Alistipes sp.]